MILNGPNLNLLGVREAHIHRSTTIATIEASCQDFAKFLGVSLEFHQSNGRIEDDGIRVRATWLDQIDECTFVGPANAPT